MDTAASLPWRGNPADAMTFRNSLKRPKPPNPGGDVQVCHIVNEKYIGSTGVRGFVTSIDRTCLKRAARFLRLVLAHSSDVWNGRRRTRAGTAQWC